jgi:hypothetical protein
VTRVPIEDLRTRLLACASLPEVAKRMGISREMVWQIANGKRWKHGCSPAQRASLEAALATPVYRRRRGPKRRIGRDLLNLDTAWAMLETASPRRAEYLAKQRTAHIRAKEFTQLPPEQRAAAARAPYGAGGAYDPVERAFRALTRARRPSFYRLAQRQLDDAFEDGRSDSGGADPHATTNRAKGLKDRFGAPLAALQLAGLVPPVIYGDEDDGDVIDPPNPQASVFLAKRRVLRAQRGLDIMVNELAAAARSACLPQRQDVSAWANPFRRTLRAIARLTIGPPA